MQPSVGKYKISKYKQKFTKVRVFWQSSLSSYGAIYLMTTELTKLQNKRKFVKSTATKLVQ